MENYQIYDKLSKERKMKRAELKRQILAPAKRIFEPRMCEVIVVDFVKKERIR